MPMTLDEQQAELNYIRSNPAEFVDFNVSWSVNISYALSFSNTFQVNRYVTTLNSSLIMNGDFNLTEKWKMGFNCLLRCEKPEIAIHFSLFSRAICIAGSCRSTLHRSDPIVLLTSP